MAIVESILTDGPAIASLSGRLAAVQEVLATLRLEGMEPTDDMRQWMQDYAAGLLPLDELGGLLNQKYGTSTGRRSLV